MGKFIIAVDPGNIQSAFVLIDIETYKPIHFEKESNVDVMIHIHNTATEWIFAVVFEMVSSYGMAVGKEVFDTVFWLGRMFQEAQNAHGNLCERFELIYRQEEKLNLCGTTRANDATIRQALIDRFAPGVSNHGKGTKKEPGWFYGFTADIWQAYAVGVTYLDKIKGKVRP